MNIENSNQFIIVSIILFFQKKVKKLSFEIKLKKLPKGSFLVL